MEMDVKVEQPDDENEPFYSKKIELSCIKAEPEDIDIEYEDVKLEFNENILIKCEKPKSKPKKSLHPCDECDYKTTSRTNLKKHQQLHQDPRTLTFHHCTECSYKTLQKGQLNRHSLTHRQRHECTLYRCQLCESTFKQNCSLTRHMQTIHFHDLNHSTNSQIIAKIEQIKVLQCDQCPYHTHKKGLMVSHMDKHKNLHDIDRLYICDVCSFSTKYRRNLRAHLTIHRKEQELKMYECNICKFRSRISYCFRRHVRSKRHLLKVGKIHEYVPRRA
ncbi:hypothetical protein ABEB36_012191 [Hypothenemus hampei]|uniref:C2H2-type domain-containing protein n=1 Tax=Hypothenemus hampei TaxID=57062 RepID=A0ABD1EB15_HYPHA